MSKKHDSCRSLQRAGAVIGEAERQSRGAARRRPVGRPASRPGGGAPEVVGVQAGRQITAARDVPQLKELLPAVFASRSHSGPLLLLRCAGRAGAALLCLRLVLQTAGGQRRVAAACSGLARGLGLLLRGVSAPDPGADEGRGWRGVAGRFAGGWRSQHRQSGGAECRGGLEACLQAGRSTCKAN